MKKLKLIVLSWGLLLVVGCSAEYPAEESHLEGALFSGQSGAGQMIFSEGTLRVMNNDPQVTPSTEPSDIEEMAQEETAIPSNGEYKVDVSASGDTYEIQTEDGFTFTLKRIGERIFEDEDGNTYNTDEYFD